MVYECLWSNPHVAVCVGCHHQQIPSTHRLLAPRVAAEGPGNNVDLGTLSNCDGSLSKTNRSGWWLLWWSKPTQKNSWLTVTKVGDGEISWNFSFLTLLQWKDVPNSPKHPWILRFSYTPQTFEMDGCWKWFSFRISESPNFQDLPRHEKQQSGAKLDHHH